MPVRPCQTCRSTAHHRSADRTPVRRQLSPWIQTYPIAQPFHWCLPRNGILEMPTVKASSTIQLRTTRCSPANTRAFRATVARSLSLSPVLVDRAVLHFQQTRDLFPPQMDKAFSHSPQAQKWYRACRMSQYSLQPQERH